MILFKTVPEKQNLSALKLKELKWKQYDNKEKVSSYKLLFVDNCDKIIELARFESFYSKNASASVCYSRLCLKVENRNLWIESKAGGYGYNKQDANFYSILDILGFKTVSTGQFDAYAVLKAIGVEFYGLNESDCYICQG